MIAKIPEQADDVRNAPVSVDPSRRLVPPDKAPGAHRARLRDDEVKTREQRMVGLVDPEQIARVEDRSPGPGDEIGLRPDLEAVVNRHRPDPVPGDRPRSSQGPDTEAVAGLRSEDRDPGGRSVRSGPYEEGVVGMQMGEQDGLWPMGEELRLAQIDQQGPVNEHARMPGVVRGGFVDLAAGPEDPDAHGPDFLSRRLFLVNTGRQR